MHDTFLLKRISESLSELCNVNKITRINKLRIVTNHDSHIQRDNLYEYLKEQHADWVGEWTNIIVDRQDIEHLTAVIERIEGDTFEE